MHMHIREGQSCSKQSQIWKIWAWWIGSKPTPMGPPKSLIVF